MKRFLFLLCAVCAFSMAYGQVLPTTPKDFFIKGGPEGKLYAIVIKSKLSNKEQIKRAVRFVEENTVRMKNEKTHVDQLDENVTEFTAPYRAGFPIVSLPGMMGLSMPVGPLWVEGELSFQFDAARQELSLGLTDLSCSNFVLTEAGTKTMEFPGGLQEKDYTPEQAALAAYKGDLAAAVSINNMFTKLLVVANSGVEGLAQFKESVKEFKQSTDKRFKEVYNPMLDLGLATYVGNADMLEFAKPQKGYKMYINMYEKAVAEGRVIGITQKFWEKRLREYVDNLFKGIAAELEGEIVGVMEDGTITWENVDGKVLPTDPKLRKKYLKSGEQY